jgi:hypothetical protein
MWIAFLKRNKDSENGTLKYTKEKFLCPPHCYINEGTEELGTYQHCTSLYCAVEYIQVTNLSSSTFLVTCTIWTESTRLSSPSRRTLTPSISSIIISSCFHDLGISWVFREVQVLSTNSCAPVMQLFRHIYTAMTFFNVYFIYLTKKWH